MATISTVYARCICRHLLQGGEAPARVFAGTGLDYDALYRQEEIELDVFRRILENCERLVVDPPVGFIIGQHHGTQALGQLGVAMNAAPDIRSGLQILEQFTRLHSTYIRVELESDLRLMRIRLHFEGVRDEALRHHVEASFMLFQRYLETVSGERLSDAHNLATYPEPPYGQRYRDYLHSRTRFEAPFLGLEIPQRWMSVRSPYYTAELFQQSQRAMAARLRERGEAEVGAYSQHVMALLRSHEPPLPALADLAQQLHISERTLNRRLQAEGTNFRELRGNLLHDWARRHLLNTENSVEAVAATLGYQDAANFRRAFRNRTGMSPGEYRQAQSP